MNEIEGQNLGGRAIIGLQYNSHYLKIVAVLCLNY